VHIELDERRAEALHLFLDDGARVEGFDDGSDAPRRRRLPAASDAGSDTSTRLDERCPPQS